MYLASSVVKSLIKNKNINIFHIDLVACPIESCITKPSQCSKGQKQSCIKKVEIVYEHDNHNKVAVLIFRYQLSGVVSEGFIRKDDFSLKLLLKRGILDKETLKAA